jgi:hypothetical protein
VSSSATGKGIFMKHDDGDFTGFVHTLEFSLKLDKEEVHLV